MRVLLDSDILIEVFRGRNAAIARQWTALAQSDSVVLISAVSFAEIGAGAKPSEQSIIDRILAPLERASVDEQTGRLAGELLRRYAPSHGLKIADALIAATAIHRRAALWTRNRKHYPMPELAIYE
jgi:predicted nucleic acid-binding protein